MATPAKTETAVLPLSQSRYNNMACPHLYRAAIRGGNDSLPAVRGREIHSFMEAYVDHCVQMEMHSDVAWFNEQMQAMGFSEGAAEILETLRDSVKVEWRKVLDIERRLYLDENFQPTQPVHPGANFGDVLRGLYSAAYEGKPDLVLLDGKTATIPDWKSQFKIENASTFQGKLYALLLMQHYPFIEKVVFELHFVRYNAKRSVEYTRDDIPALKKAAENARRRQQELHVMIGQGVDGSAMPALPGAHCVYCPLLHNGCPIADNPFSQSAEDALSKIVWATQLIKRERQVVVAQLNRDGDCLTGLGGKVEIEDGNGDVYRAEFAKVEKSHYPLNETVDILGMWKNSTGEDLSAALQVGATKLNSLAKAKKRLPLRESLDEIRQVVTETKLVVRGIEDEDEAA